MTIRLGILGAGAHCLQFHLPALVDWIATHPGEVEVVAVCDRDPDRVAVVQAALGGELVVDWQQLLTLNLDGLLAITPPSFTPTVIRACVENGLPVMMEKPLADDLATAEALVQAIGEAPHMVSMNRRFDPALCRARQWLAGRQIDHVRATFAREQRIEPQFVEETGVHIVDAVASLIGPLRWFDGHCWKQGGTRSFHLNLAGTVPVLIDIWPAGGINQECIECFGDGWRIEIRSGWFDLGVVRAWQGKELVLDESIDANLPEWRKAGVDVETDAFLRMLQGQQPWAPKADEILPSARICAKARALSVG